MGSLRVRSRAKRKGLNRQARAKLWRSAGLHFDAAKGFGEVAATKDAAAVSEEALPIVAALALAGLARGMIQELRHEATFKSAYHLSDGLGALAAVPLVGRRPKAPMWWGGSNV